MREREREREEGEREEVEREEVEKREKAAPVSLCFCLFTLSIPISTFSNSSWRVENELSRSSPVPSCPARPSCDVPFREPVTRASSPERKGNRKARRSRSSIACEAPF